MPENLTTARPVGRPYRTEHPGAARQLVNGFRLEAGTVRANTRPTREGRSRNAFVFSVLPEYVDGAERTRRRYCHQI
jgi:hypothetical protein